ncbi:hypothetical protein POPTR_018G110375v4 [Populus trichocarpa]|uniref:Uncharacterized protein n=1 Tax=Populus trichocarpa TaxID=3694 RepID=A0ACC0RPT1_POPTR|nr:hypothetical protein BDE02_18G094100 [Populus trichocarpa]KAI9378550.1 hypothetical protein POPTR_018G110375v4 [Populus trichocarpa]
MNTHFCLCLSLSTCLSLSETVCKGAVMISSLCRNQAGRGHPSVGMVILNGCCEI